MEELKRSLENQMHTINTITEEELKVINLQFEMQSDIKKNHTP